jgi:hypothetical protein
MRSWWLEKYTFVRIGLASRYFLTKFEWPEATAFRNYLIKLDILLDLREQRRMEDTYRPCLSFSLVHSESAFRLTLSVPRIRPPLSVLRVRWLCCEPFYG